jgi:sulfhydrogenase subunit beta (sulfur reductase)
MLFKKLKKSEIECLFNEFKSRYRIVAPVKAGEDKNGSEIFTFAEVEEFDKIKLDYSFTKMSPKKFLFDYSEKLASFTFDDEKRSWEKEKNREYGNPIAFFGLHACDINAFNKLDKVLMDSIYPDPNYVHKRRNAFIIGIDCMPSKQCFCRSLGTDHASHGYDLFLTDIGDFYDVEILTSRAFELVSKLQTTEVTKEDNHIKREKDKRRSTSFKNVVDTTDLTKILDMEFQSNKWEIWGEKCLGCGTCSRVCPTCYCYGVSEDVDLKFSEAVKKRHLYSCNIIDFAEVSGGHNFRPHKSTRLKYRYYHKHRGFVEKYEESLCVGCGRCGEQCLAKITVPEVIASIREDD